MGKPPVCKILLILDKRTFGGIRMRAVRYHEYGGPEVLVVDEVDRPEPGEDEVLVDVRAAGVNPVDTYFREGSYEPVSLPMIPGSDFAGEVVSVGHGVGGFEEGDRVFGTGLGNDSRGSYAEYTVSPKDWIEELPESVTFVEGAAVALVGVTAWRALIHHGDLGPADTCLVHGASGGVGHVAVQLASSAGADVIGTAGNEAAMQRVRELGANLVLDYDSEDLKGSVLDYDKAGPDVILDHRLDDYLQFDLDVAANGGRIVGIGESDGDVVLTDTPTGRGKELSIQLMSMFNTPDMARVLEILARMMDRGELNPVISETFSLEEASEAQRKVMEESFVGKLVIEP